MEVKQENDFRSVITDGGKFFEDQQPPNQVSYLFQDCSPDVKFIFDDTYRDAETGNSVAVSSDVIANVNSGLDLLSPDTEVKEEKLTGDYYIIVNSSHIKQENDGNKSNAFHKTVSLIPSKAYSETSVSSNVRDVSRENAIKHEDMSTDLSKLANEIHSSLGNKDNEADFLENLVNYSNCELFENNSPINKELIGISSRKLESKCLVENCRFTVSSEDLKKMNIQSKNDFSSTNLCEHVFSNFKGQKGTESQEIAKVKLCESNCSNSLSKKQRTRTHTGDESLKCKICESKFTQSSNLKKHMRIHTGEKPYLCNICGFKFTESSSLKRHMRIHTGEKLFKCEICGIKFTQSGNLKSHIRIHTGEKPFCCEICEMKFTDSSNLKKHIGIHTGRKLSECEICGIKFTRIFNLKSHIRIHTGEKPFECDVCGLKFSLINYLKSHMRTHTGERPFHCKICEKKYALSKSLKKHMRTHTG